MLLLKRKQSFRNMLLLKIYGFKYLHFREVTYSCHDGVCNPHAVYICKWIENIIENT